jgi:hypothetical protein
MVSLHSLSTGSVVRITGEVLLSKVLQYHNGNVTVTVEAEGLPEVIKVKESENWRDIIEYVYWNHDRDSMYHVMLPEERSKIVRSDRFSHVSETGYRELKKKSVALVKKLDMLQFSSNERLMIGIEKKIEEYLEYWNKIKINEDNHKLVADTIDRAESLLKIKERIGKMVNKEIETKRMGGGGNTLIEELAG